MESDGKFFPCHLPLSATGTPNLSLMTNAVFPAETSESSVTGLLKHTFF